MVEIETVYLYRTESFEIELLLHLTAYKQMTVV